MTRLQFNGDVEECQVCDFAIQKAANHRLLGIFDFGKQHTISITLLQGNPGMSFTMDMVNTDSVSDNFFSQTDLYVRKVIRKLILQTNI